LSFAKEATNAIAGQRDRALDEAASAEAKLSMAQKQIAALQKQIGALKPKDAPAPEKPKD